LVVALSTYFLGHMVGDEEGFTSSYEAGYEDGVNKGLGLTREESRELYELAIDAQVWGSVKTDEISPAPPPPQP
jgi:hypothetical protein